MTARIKNNRKKFGPEIAKKHYGKKFGLILASVMILIITVSIASATMAENNTENSLPMASSLINDQISPQSIQNALNTYTATAPNQFDVKTVYAYAGEKASNASYKEENGVVMYRTTLYPVSIILNCTCLPGIQIAGCDAAIELYTVQVTSNSGLTERYGYFIGTNYNPTFSAEGVQALMKNATDFFVQNTVVTYAMGSFQLNMTANTSILSNPIGSLNCYSIYRTGQGLWAQGKPNALSVTVQRIGYITIANGTDSYYKVSAQTVNPTSTTLDNYNDGFLKNSVVPAAQLPQKNPFNPTR